jgi:hypothetical protein
LANRAEDIEHLDAFIAEADRYEALERERCAPAERECLKACASFGARCPAPYRMPYGCMFRDYTSAMEFCADACRAREPYLMLARLFRESDCHFGRAADR